MDDNSNSSVPDYILPLRDVVWLEPPAFQEELVKSPTFDNSADPILRNIVIKDIFAWVYLVSTGQITNRASLEIIGIGYNSSEMDRDQYSGNCLFNNIEEDNGRGGEVQKKILCTIYANEDIHKRTYTKMYLYTNVDIHKWTYTQM